MKKSDIEICRCGARLSASYAFMHAVRSRAMY
jgi:hypothetical protein